MRHLLKYLSRDATSTAWCSVQWKGPVEWAAASDPSLVTCDECLAEALKFSEEVIADRQRRTLGAHLRELSRLPANPVKPFDEPEPADSVQRRLDQLEKDLASVREKLRR